MKFTLLSQPFVVGGYFVFVSTIWLMISLLVSLLKLRTADAPPVARQRHLLKTAIGLLACGICFGFFFDSMFLRFNSAQVGVDRVSLQYCWPRPARVIPHDQLRQAELTTYAKGKAELVVVTETGEVRSIVCTIRERAILENLHQAIAELKDKGPVGTVRTDGL